ncbi:hypothetical protein [Mucilaginibacter segetis]|uniref:AlgX/AlgJ SGNH hydrolase-like domain-containing protein n=1 Tax=Mucilaginibacter segetis TaxID=2793071 RepID=A0A934PP96_9SPHI|nr:hypothetical protein [Mucilaginibacter segetis]MBK0378199.1 hypothetical protein [Mucilaginibacter segetis]
MTRKVIGVLVLMFSIALLTTAMNQSFINRIKQAKYFDHLNNTSSDKSSIYEFLFIKSDRWEYGDLYGVSFLSQYKIKLQPFTTYKQNKHKPVTNRILYIIGDSFLADKSLAGAFKAFDNVVFLDRRFPFGPIVLDSTKQNYLIMEFAERNLNGYDLKKTGETIWKKKEIQAGLNFNSKFTTSKSQKDRPSVFTRLGNIIFNKDLNRNLELLLFDNKVTTPFKEAKASLNYNLLGRVSKEVTVSTDRKRLLFNITVDTSNLESGFRPISDKEKDSIADHLNTAKNYYRSIGFKNVFLSVVPNAASIYDENRMPYNHLQQRIEKTVHFPFIPLYNTFKKSPHNLFSLSDSHWNPLGFNTWVKQADSTLNVNLN